MSHLKDVNVKESLSFLKEFYDAVTLTEQDAALREKKERAGAALNHLESLFSAKPREVQDDENSRGCPECAQKAHAYGNVNNP